MSDLSKVEIFTDGSCLKNPGGPGGYGVILKCGERYKELSGGLESTTNNYMELMAVFAGLRALKKRCDITIYSDSQYVVNIFSKGWIYKWMRNGWRTSTGEVKNQELLLYILEELEKHVWHFVWVKGHAGHPENERCDKLANAEAHKFKNKRPKVNIDIEV